MPTPTDRGLSKLDAQPRMCTNGNQWVNKTGLTWRFQGLTSGTSRLLLEFILTVLLHNFIAQTQAPTPENKNTERGLPHDEAVRFLKSWLDWVQMEEGRTYGDPIVEAIQRPEQLIVTRTTEGRASSQSGAH